MAKSILKASSHDLMWNRVQSCIMNGTNPRVTTKELQWILLNHKGIIKGGNYYEIRNKSETARVITFRRIGPGVYELFAPKD